MQKMEIMIVLIMVRSPVYESYHQKINNVKLR